MPAFQDLTGQRFGKLVVIDRAPNAGPNVMWNCRCDCGNERQVYGMSLKRKGARAATSCGCERIKSVAAAGRGNAAKIVGKKFGRLMVVGDSVSRAGRKILWKCVCDCGQEVSALSSNLIAGKSRSCGCLRIDAIQERHEYAAAMKRIEEELAADCDNCGGDDVREENGFDGASYDVCVDCGDVGSMREAEPVLDAHATHEPAKVAAKLPPPVATGRRLPWGGVR